MSVPHHSHYDLHGKVAIVAGGSRGIGRAISERLAREGAAVVVNYASNDAAANDAVQTINQGGGQALAVKADLSRVEEIKRLFDEAEAAFGGIDIAVANAATAVIKPFVEFPKTNTTMCSTSTLRACSLSFSRRQDVCETAAASSSPRPAA